jgi:alanyl-tRNA synthetase
MKAKHMTSSEVRRKFIDYFKRNAHTEVASSSLIPENDPTLLFANAGMNQFKNLFLGLEHRDYKRAVTSQKCVRAGGKHNDLENVGFTARHHTFFEMLGNFSFGDYFKKDAIRFAWEFLTAELKIPKEKLYVTVHHSDDEAADIWHKEQGVPKDRIFKLGDDNFWRMGDIGPCGPCTEIFYDHGPRGGKESDPKKGIESGEDRFVEIWNLVFMQFYESAPGKQEKLPKPSVDTGSGLERVCAVMQEKLSNYDTDLFIPLIEKAAEVSGKKNLLKEIEKMNEEGIHSKASKEIKDQVAALRVVADHVRSGSFLIADGALPSNEGRGYVLRRILRRAIRFSQKLSGGNPFLPEIAEVLIDTMGDVYPELRQRRDVVLATLNDEQSRFMSTLVSGTAIFEQEIGKLKANNKKKIPGEIVFRLYDTYGFPADLTGLMAEEHGFTVDEQEFETHMEAAREKAKASWKGKAMASDEAHLVALAQEARDQKKLSVFTGYQSTSLSGSKILFVSSGTGKVSSLKAGTSGVLVLEKTPFYAEGGGQAGDKGIIRTAKGKAQVLDCTKVNEVFMHHVNIETGEISAGELADCQVTDSARRNTAANHSATHLLHSALRKVLGTHVTQAGQMVDEQRIRFDFSHGKAVSPAELTEIEDLVNDEISKAIPVETQLMKHKEAIAAGAMALFGEKYGDEVRVLKMGNFSTELCGGTHVTNTAQIRVFKLVSESGVSAGVRRIEALAGDIAVKFMMMGLKDSLDARRAAGLDIAWDKVVEGRAGSLPEFIEKKKDEIKALEKEFKKAQGGQVDLDKILASALSVKTKKGDAKLIVANLDIDDREVLATIVDHLKNKVASGIIVVSGAGAASRPTIVSVSKNLNPEISAGNLLKALANGKGGGRPDFAQGAVTELPDPAKITELL